MGGRRSRTAALVGALLLTGATIAAVAGAVLTASTAPALAATTLTVDYKCTFPAPVGATTTAISLSATAPSAVTPGGSLSLTGAQAKAPVAKSTVALLESLGVSSLSGTVTEFDVVAKDASPGTLDLAATPIPFTTSLPMPAATATILVPPQPATFGPWTATGAGPVTLTPATLTFVAYLPVYHSTTIPCSAPASAPSFSIPVQANATTTTAPSTTTTAPSTTTTAPSTTTTAPALVSSSRSYTYTCTYPIIGATSTTLALDYSAPSSVSPGESFSLTGVQTHTAISKAIVEDLSALKLSSLAGTVTAFDVAVSGASPTSLDVGAGSSFSEPIPSPPATVTITAPIPPTSAGPVTVAAGASEVLFTPGRISVATHVGTVTCDPSGTPSPIVVPVALTAAVVPAAHTGEPWAGWPYWLLVSLLGVGGLGALERSRRLRRPASQGG
jgi:hypothetical protein